MRGLVFVLLAAVVASLFSYIALSTGNTIAEASTYNEFKTFTSAVCEHKSEAVHCRDEIFVNCNGNISKVVDFAECNGIRLDVQKPTGFAVFENGWKDPRNEFN